MINSKILKVVGAILLIASIITVLIGAHNINEAKGMLATISAGNKLFGYSSASERGVSAWNDHLSTAKTVTIVGVAVAIIGAITMFIGFIKSNAVKNPETKKVVIQESYPVPTVSVKEKSKYLKN